MSSRVAVVTGSNKGIGFAIIRGLCKQFKGDVYLTSRDVGRGEAAVAELNKEGLSPKFHQLDIDNEASVQALATFLKEKYGGFDIFVNNAGIAFNVAAPDPFDVQAEVTLRTNYFNTLRACEIILPLAKPGSRLVNVSSMVAPMALKKCSPSLAKELISLNKIEDLTKKLQSFVESAKDGTYVKKGWPQTAYGVSKLGVSLMTTLLQAQADKLGKDDILVNCCCPGYVDTDMTNHKGHKTIDQGADTPLYLALLPPGTKSPHGEHLSDRKIVDWKKV